MKTHSHKLKLELYSYGCKLDHSYLIDNPHGPDAEVAGAEVFANLQRGCNEFMKMAAKVRHMENGARVV